MPLSTQQAEVIEAQLCELADRGRVAARGKGSSGRRLLAVVRPEEWLLLAILAIATGCCLGTGLGFTFKAMFRGYMVYFGLFFFYLFIGSRVLFVAARDWRPTSPFLGRFRRWLVGSNPSSERLLETDIELLRSALFLFLTLTVYSNLKVRLPFINPTLGDPAFLSLDTALFGTAFTEWCQQYAAGSPTFSAILTRTYNQGYLYFMVLLMIYYFRQQPFNIRWASFALAFTYILGILISLAYPSYGPFAVAPQDFEWLKFTESGEAQEWLVHAFQASKQAVAAGRAPETTAFAGIAAFPSLQIAHMVVLTLLCCVTFRCCTPVMLLATAVMFFATIAYGRHYIVDAIGGAILAVGCTVGMYLYLKRCQHETNRTGPHLAGKGVNVEDELASLSSM